MLMAHQLGRLRCVRQTPPSSAGRRRGCSTAFQRCKVAKCGASPCEAASGRGADPYADVPAPLGRGLAALSEGRGVLLARSTWHVYGVDGCDAAAPGRTQQQPVLGVEGN